MVNIILVFAILAFIILRIIIFFFIIFFAVYYLLMNHYYNEFFHNEFDLENLDQLTSPTIKDIDEKIERHKHYVEQIDFQTEYYEFGVKSNSIVVCDPSEYSY